MFNEKKSVIYRDMSGRARYGLVLNVKMLIHLEKKKN